MSVVTLAAAFAVLALAAATQAVTGFGFALVSVPLLTLLLGPRAAVVGVLVVGLGLAVAVAARERGHVRRQDAVVVSAAALIGMPVGVILLSSTGERLLTGIIALVLLMSTFLVWRGMRLPRGRPTEVTVGAISGALLTSTGMNGPPLVVAFQAQGMHHRQLRATLSVVFVLQGVAALMFLSAAGQVTADVLALLAVAVPAMTFGWLVGDRLFRRLDALAFRRGVLLLLVVAALSAAASAVAGA